MLVIVVAATLAPGASGQYVRYYFDEPLELQLDVTQIAVCNEQPQEHADERTRLLRDTDIVGVDYESVPIRGWALAQVAAEARSEAGIEDLVANLTATMRTSFIAPVFIDDFGGPLIPTRDIFVKFHDDVEPDAADRVLAGMKSITVVARDYGGFARLYRLQSNSRNGFDVLNIANLLAERPDVEFAEPDMIFTGRSHIIPNDAEFDEAWGLHNVGQPTGCIGDVGVENIDMNGPEAWDLELGDPSTIVLIIDSGYEFTHPDINHSGFGEDFTGEGGGGAPVHFCDRHGMAVAGCVSGIINNNIGSCGIAPNCTVASARPFIPTEFNAPCSGNWTTMASWTVDALAWGFNTVGARVTNNSNGYGFTSAMIQAAYGLTALGGQVHFASAGNDGTNMIGYPASLASVNAVSAIDKDGTIALFSDRGPGLAFCAPGVDIHTTDRVGANGYNSSSDYTCVDGTSFASPYAAGVAALILSVDDSLGPVGVGTVMALSAKDLGAPGYDETFGWGIAHARGAMDIMFGVDCNNNFIPDVLDIDLLHSEDCNLNKTPDECELGNCLNQYPNGIAALVSDWNCDDCGSGVQIMADQLRVAAPRNLTAFRWWGIYIPNDQAAIHDQFTIEIRPDNGGQPGAAPIHSWGPFEADLKLDTGDTIVGYRVFEYTHTLDAPAPLPAGDYWVLIYNNTTSTTDAWYWMTGWPDLTQGALFASFSTTGPDGPWLPELFSMAWRLWCAEEADNDCNTNGVPDECELETNDCNLNGVPDDCDTKPDGDPSVAVEQDLCENAMIVCPGFDYFGSNVNVASSMPFFCGLFWGNQDVWYRYRPAWDGVLFVRVEGPPIYWLYAIYDGCPPTGSEIECNEQDHFQIVIDVEAGHDYYIRIASWGNEPPGLFEMNLIGPDCALNVNDLNGNGIPDICECLADVNGDNVVNNVDAALVAAAQGTTCNGCPEDVNGDGVVNDTDWSIVLNNQGPCPFP